MLKLNLRAKSCVIGIIKLFLVAEHNPVSGTEHRLQNRSKPRDVPAGRRFGDDDTHADAEFSIPSSFFSVLPRVHRVSEMSALYWRQLSVPSESPRGEDVWTTK